jgi:hypothetical protein
MSFPGITGGLPHTGTRSQTAGMSDQEAAIVKGVGQFSLHAILEVFKDGARDGRKRYHVADTYWDRGNDADSSSMLDLSSGQEEEHTCARKT